MLFPAALTNVAALGGGAVVAPTGATATTLSLAPSTQWHPNTSTLAMRVDGTFTGYISNGTSGVAGSILTVTALSASTCRPLVGEMVLKTGAAVGTTIWGGISGSGGTGTYRVSQSQAVGTSGSPVTFTVQGDQITSISDLKGLADLTSQTGVEGPILMTEPGTGIKFLRFYGGQSNFTPWLRNNLVTGIDSHNQTFIMVGRFYGAWDTTPRVVVIPGTQDNANYSLEGMGVSNGFPSVRSRNLGFTSSGASNLKKLFLGHQLQVVATSAVTDNGYGTAANVPIFNYFMVNEQGIAESSSNGSRQNNVTGLSLGRSNNSTAFFDLYELIGYVRGEMGNSTTQQARVQAAVASAMTNWGIVPITKHLQVFGDSRYAYSIGAIGSNVSDGTQTSIGALLGERGRTWSLPGNVRVCSSAVGGQGVGVMSVIMEQQAATANLATHPCSPGMQLGGGNDYFLSMMWVNDYGLWPSTTNGGTTATGTAATVNDFWSGPGYAGAATATVSSGSSSVALTGVSGALGPGSLITSGSWANGGFTNSPATATPASMTLYVGATAAHTSEAITTRLDTYVQTFTRLLARGYKGMQMAETASGTSWTAAQLQIRSIHFGTALSDLNAGPGQTYDGKFLIGDQTQVTVSGVKPLDISGYANGISNSQYMGDNVHLSIYGRKLAVSGGDTPQNGLGMQAKTLVAL